MDAVTSFFTDSVGGNTAYNSQSSVNRNSSVDDSFIRNAESKANKKNEASGGVPGNGTAKSSSTSNSQAGNANNDKNNLASSIGKIIGSSSSNAQQLLTEKFVEKMIYMALPSASNIKLGKNEMTSFEYRIAAAKSRPGLSVQIMSKNFIAMNSRLSFPFFVMDEIIKLLNWENYNFTLVVLFLISFTILKPIPTLTSVPIFYVLFGVMTPAYMKLHKPDEWNTIFETNPVPACGPALETPDIPKPVPELSKEFILNLTDLQNHMSIYVVVFDIVSKIMCKFAFYCNEPLSISIFIVLLLVGFFNVFYLEVLTRIVPIKLILIATVWLFSVCMHPQYRDSMLNRFSSEETRLRWVTLSNKWERHYLERLELQEPESKDLKVACIYEIQKYNDNNKAWELIGFCNDDYSLFSDLRIQEIDLCQMLNSQDGNTRANASSGNTAANTSTANYTKMNLTDVAPPKDWCWLPKSQWNLDLNVTKWVKENLLQCVEIDEEEKWVYDLNFPECLARGEFRRRRWIRVCTRKTNVDVQSKRSSIIQTSSTGVGKEPSSPTSFSSYADDSVVSSSSVWDSEDEDEKEQQALMQDVIPRDLLSGVVKK